MKIVFLIYTIGLGMLLGHYSFAEGRNELLNRDFWKSHPGIDQIQEKIDQGHSPTAMTRFHFDATGYAILENNPIETITFLLGQGNDVNKITHDARTYIFWAAYKGNLELMKYLVDKGAKTDIKDQHGYTLLMFAASTGQANTAIYDYCIELGADIRTERARDGRNALLAYAGKMKHFEGIEYFLKKGLDIHSTDPDGNGIFHHAAKTGNEAFMKRLIAEYGVDYKKNPKTNENAILFASRRFERSGAETPLSFYKYLEGLSLNPAIVSKTGENALLNLSARTKNLEVFTYFIEKGIDPNQVDEEGNNPLIRSASTNSKEVTQLFLKETKDVNRKNKEGHTALTKAVQKNKLEVVEMLLNAGASVDIADDQGKDLGYYAIDAFRGDLPNFKKRISLLKEKGFTLNKKQKDGSSLLHTAIKKDNTELVGYLMEEGLKLNATDNEGQTVLHLAALQASSDHMLKYLVAAGADKSAMTTFDESAYDLASQNEALTQNNVNIDFLKL